MWKKSRLEVLSKKSTSYRGLAKILKSDHQLVKRALEHYGINVDHFDPDNRALAEKGKVYNLLTIDKVFRENERWFCNCTCICGNKVKKRLDSVTSSRVPSCGCASRNRPQVIAGKNGFFRGCGEIRGTHMRNIKAGATRRGLEFSVTKEYLWNLFEAQGRCCALTGVALIFGRVYYPHETTASLDRIDSSKGYSEGNVQWVLKSVNKIKMDLEQWYFIELCHLVSNHTHKCKPQDSEKPPQSLVQ